MEKACCGSCSTLVSNNCVCDPHTTEILAENCFESESDESNHNSPSSHAHVISNELLISSLNLVPTSIDTLDDEEDMETNFLASSV